MLAVVTDTVIATRPVSAINPYDFQFTMGTPASPTPWNPSTWDIAVHIRDGYQNGGIESMMAGHGADCGAPPAMHAISTYSDAVFVCKNHVMTSLNASSYGAIYLTPDHMLDWSGGTATLTYTQSTFRTSFRDWTDLWITPFNENLELPLESFLPDLQGPPRDAVHIRMDNFNNGTNFKAEIYSNFQSTALPSSWWTTLESKLGPSAGTRTMFQVDISQNHLRFGIPSLPTGGSMWWVDSGISIPFTRGVVQFGHHSYTPLKFPCGAPVEQAALGLGCAPNTWHWGGVDMTSAVPFSLIRAKDRVISPSTTNNTTFPVPAPAGSFLRFNGIGALQVSFDGGKTWAAPQTQQESKHVTTHFENYWTPIPQGATSVLFQGQSWFGGPWYARDLAVWSQNASAGAPPPPTTQPAPSALPTPSKPPSPVPSPTPAPVVGPGALTIVGNHFVANGQAVRLLGVNRAGSEYMCTGTGTQVFDGPSDDASIAAMAAWKINTVRVPLNEDCWLGINGLPAAYSAATYQQAIVAYVNRLHAHGLYAVLDLHWNAPGAQPSKGQQVMADADHSPAFWSSVASTFKSDGKVVFDLYNEPHGISWTCLRDGCLSGFQTAGMQSLVNAVRATGAKQPILAGGLGYSGDLSQWLSFKPSDPQLAASFHTYNFSGCASTCWNATVKPVATVNPVVTGELGENDCAHGYIDAYMNFADAQGISYLAWAWNPYSCTSFPSLISAYDGTPTNFGIGFRNHLLGLTGAAPAPTQAPLPTPSPEHLPTPSPVVLPSPVPVPPSSSPSPSPSPEGSASPSPSPSPSVTPPRT
jgi:hypothetical protein